MQIRKALTAAMAAAAMTLCCSGLNAAAYTADDVAAKARASGWPEYLIQMGYNEWASGNYSQEALDKAYASVSTYNDDVREAVANSLGVDPDTLPEAAPATTAATEAPTQTTTTTEVPSGGTVSTDAPGNPGSSEQGSNENLVITKTDGTQETRVSKSDFINMSLEEKQAYVASLTEESKTEFVASLSTAEKNSLLKQLPVDEKASIIQNYIDAAGTMGLDVTVDALTGDNISLTMRNEEGTVVGMTNVGVTIDETGISHTKQLVFGAVGTLLSLAGFGALAHRMRRED